ncbi:hypothetical protein ABV518_05565 [Arthrobacter sp. HS15c]
MPAIKICHDGKATFAAISTPRTMNAAPKHTETAAINFRKDFSLFLIGGICRMREKRKRE